MQALSELVSGDVRLPYKVSNCSFLGSSRFIVSSRFDLRPSLCLSIYETHLSNRRLSPNTVKRYLNELIYLLKWGDLNSLNLNKLLCNGEALHQHQIRSYSVWLYCFLNDRSRKTNGVSDETFNAILATSARLISYFVRMFSFPNIGPNERALKVSLVVEEIEKTFLEQKKKVKKKPFAGDLSEEQIYIIEQYLKPDNRNVNRNIAVRDYLIWRLVMEFGLRIGEILALRVGDCPHQFKDSISIVRVDERGNEYLDPRGANAPRPKTLSRQLGFLMENSVVKKYLNEYCTLHRRRKVTKFGLDSSSFVMDQPDFLLLSHHHECGAPLPVRSASYIAEIITKETGVPFHWHLGRHAFFNRAYSSIVNDPEYSNRLMDLVFWGGWSSAKSLGLYTNRSIKERAETALRFCHEGGNIWEALN